MKSASENYTGIYNAYDCNVTSVNCRNGYVTNNVEVGGTIYEGGVTLSNKYIGFQSPTGGYYGMTVAGANNVYVRTTTLGFLPYQSGGSGTLGTSGWPFNTIYGKTIYENGKALSDKYLSLSGGSMSGNINMGSYTIVDPKIPNIYSNGAIYLNSVNGTYSVALTTNGNWVPIPDTSGALGSGSYRWSAVYAIDTSINASDKKLKDNIDSIPFATDLIMSLNPVTFMWKKGDHRRKRMGFIAQDVASVCNNLGENLSVVTALYKDKPEGEDEYFGEDVDDELLSWSLSYD